MGGASFASAELSADSLMTVLRFRVIPSGEGVIEARLEASPVVMWLQLRYGGCRLTCSCSEMAAKGGLGLSLISIGFRLAKTA